MSDENGSQPRAGTTAALDRRVENLEHTVAGLVADVRVVQAGMTTQNAQQVATLAKLDLLLSAQALAATMAADPEATPAGRFLLSESRRSHDAAALAQAGVEQLKVRVAFAAGAVAVITTLVTLLSPFIRAAFHLP